MFQLAALYKFTQIADPVAFKQELMEICTTNSICGALIVATEGINGTIAGLPDKLNVLISRLTNDPLFSGIELKYSFSEKMPFYHMRISVKQEIVTIGVCDLPISIRGEYVDALKWNDLLIDPDVLVIDTRNEYEIGLGTFKNAVNPETENFREFPTYVKEKLDTSKHTKVAMFCTGGIRCEKASSFMLKEGFQEVYHLKGGILQYLEDIKKINEGKEEEEKIPSLWEGECYVFDQRVSVTGDLEPGNYVLCRGCRMPLSKKSTVDNPLYIEGVSCQLCHDKITEKQIESNRERNKQIMLAKERNVSHLGYNHPGHRKKQKI